MKTRAWVMIVGVAALPLLMAPTCGGDDAAVPYVSTFCSNNPYSECTADLDCADGIFCNGIERCSPGAATADECGCMPANPARACLAAQTCYEAEDRCDLCRTDADGDGHRPPECGGDDCDDSDPNRFPGRMEVCDAANHDEDCDPMSYGLRDADGDQFSDGTCCNVGSTGMHCGTDCDDTNAAIVPGAQQCYKSASTNVLICQLTGSFSAPVPCGGALTCVEQPNGLGVCQ